MFFILRARSILSVKHFNVFSVAFSTSVRDSPRVKQESNTRQGKGLKHGFPSESETTQLDSSKEKKKKSVVFK